VQHGLRSRFSPEGGGIRPPGTSRVAGIRPLIAIAFIFYTLQEDCRRHVRVPVPHGNVVLPVGQFVRLVVGGRVALGVRSLNELVELLHFQELHKENVPTSQVSYRSRRATACANVCLSDFLEEG
jgi:hypothetical protein